MPGPVVAKPELPYWADPANASVFDAPGQGLLRKVVGLLGLDDPNQIMALGMPLEVGGMTGGLLEKVASKFPRFANAIKAYHGSPHDFEKFDVSKIGTGEGAQAYGHGLYFAEKEEIAKSYRDALGSVTTTPSYPDLRKAMDEAAEAGIAALRNPSPSTEAAARTAQSRVSDIQRRVASEPKGKMYEVAIKADPEHFLDWDNPLSQQSPQVQQQIKAAYIADPEKHGNLTGRQLLDRAGAQTGMMGAESQREASRMLGEAGIPGIKYLDQGSRGPRPPYRGDSAYLNAAESFRSSGHTAEGTLSGLKQAYSKANPAELQAAVHEAFDITPETRNFVVFDDKTVEILRKYGILLPAAGLAQQAVQPQAQQP